MPTAASPSPSPTDLNLARAHLLVAHANQARKKPKGPHNSHKGTKVAADKENENLSMKKKKVMLRVDFVYRADRLIPCGMIIYTVTSTSPWRGLSALELLIRSQLQLRVYSIMESPKCFKAKLTRYCS